MTATARWSRTLLTLGVCLAFVGLAAGTSQPRERAEDEPASTAAVAAPPPPAHPLPLTAITVSAPYFKPDGRAWDVGAGAPDLVAHVRQGGHQLVVTQVARDQYTARFAVDPVVMLDADAPLDVEVIDRDAAAHDGVGTASFRAVRESGRFFARLPEGGRVTLEVGNGPAEEPTATIPPDAQIVIAEARAAIAARDFRALQALMAARGDYSIRSDGTMTASRLVAIAAWRRDPAMLQGISRALGETCMSREDRDARIRVICPNGAEEGDFQLRLEDLGEGYRITRVEAL